MNMLYICAFISLEIRCQVLPKTLQLNYVFAFAQLLRYHVCSDTLVTIPETIIPLHDITFSVHMLHISDGMSVVSLTLNENIILADVSISPSKSINHTIEISDTERPVSLALHIESELNDDTNFQTPSEPLVEHTVTNPNGFKVNQNQIGRNGQSDLFTSFRPQTDGIYTLTLSNRGTDQVKVQDIFGYYFWDNNTNSWYHIYDIR